ncbi:hypothetical protein [Ruegeria sp. MALMAid1280]|uniref:hypothetical protein n=1 Tax=Ruegeria sp. MALMAid1280 TaxID=3411634 RepID=UPI003B9FD583
MTFRIRPITSPWKLAGRIALVVFVSCFVCNAIFWAVPYFQLFGTRCRDLCPQSIEELIKGIGVFGFGASVVSVPVAVLVMTPLVQLSNSSFKSSLQETPAFLLAVFVSSVITMGVGAFLLVAVVGVPKPLKYLIALSPVVFSILGLTFVVALSLLTIEKMLKTRKKKKV